MTLDSFNQGDARSSSMRSQRYKIVQSYGDQRDIVAIGLRSAYHLAELGEAGTSLVTLRTIDECRPATADLVVVVETPVPATSVLHVLAQARHGLRSRGLAIVAIAVRNAGMQELLGSARLRFAHVAAMQQVVMPRMKIMVEPAAEFAIMAKPFAAENDLTDDAQHFVLFASDAPIELPGYDLTVATGCRTMDRSAAVNAPPQDASLKDAQSRLAEIESSTSWQLTAPLRALSRASKKLRMTIAASLLSPAVESKFVKKVAPPEVVEAVLVEHPLQMPLLQEPEREPEPIPSPPLDSSRRPCLRPFSLEETARQRQALGLDIVPGGLQIGVLLPLGQETPIQRRQCTGSAWLAFQRAGVTGKIIVSGNADVSTVPVRGLGIGRETGSGETRNLLLESGFSDGADLCILVDPRGAFHPDAILALTRVALAHDRKALIEASLFPDEHPKFTDPVSLETAWAGGWCLAISREFYEVVGGFDEELEGLAQLVDLSCRAHARGMAVLTAPTALFQAPLQFKAEDEKHFFEQLRSGLSLARKCAPPEFEYPKIVQCPQKGRIFFGNPTSSLSASTADLAPFLNCTDFSAVRW